MSDVDLRGVKAEIRRLLPRDHPVRAALEREPDRVPEEEWRTKVVTYARVLLASREGGR